MKLQCTESMIFYNDIKEQEYSTVHPNNITPTPNTQLQKKALDNRSVTSFRKTDKWEHKYRALTKDVSWSNSLLLIMTLYKLYKENPNWTQMVRSLPGRVFCSGRTPP